MFYFSEKAEGYRQAIKVGNCRKPPCKLKKKSTVKGEFRFVPGKCIKVTLITLTIFHTKIHNFPNF